MCVFCICWFVGDLMNILICLCVLILFVYFWFLCSGLCLCECFLVNNFVFLARNNFYDGLTFHRVIEGFVAQGGDPTGVGMGGSGYQLTEEFNDIYLDREGLLSMAKSPVGVSGSQFFITLGPTPWLTGDFTVFGEVVDGMDVAHDIQVREPGSGQPEAEVIARIEIVER